MRSLLLFFLAIFTSLQKRKWKLFVCTISCLLFIEATAQEYSIARYGIQDGLGSSTVYAIYQDTKGYLWVSTSAGVSRFDGREFKNFTSRDGLIAESVQSIHEDAGGNVWFRSNGDGKRSKAAYFDGHKFRPLEGDSLQPFGQGRIFFYKDGAEPLWLRSGEKDLLMLHSAGDLLLKNGYESLKHNHIYNVYKIAENHYYLATLLGLVEYKDSTYTNLTKAVNRTTQVFQIDSLYGQYWLHTDEGIMHFDGKNFDYKNIPLALQKNITHSMRKDKSGNLWFATIRGLYQFDGESFQHYTTDDGLPSNRIDWAFLDSKERLWLSIKEGLGVFDGSCFQKIEENGEMDLWRDGYRMRYREILEDHEGNIWFNSLNGISRFQTFAFEHYHVENLLKSSYVTSVLEDRAGRTWFAYRNKGLSICEQGECEHFSKESNLGTDMVFDLLEAKDGTVWIATVKGVYRYKDGKFRPLQIRKEVDFEPILKLEEDEKGNIWLASRYGLVYRYDGKKFQEFPIKTNEEGFNELSFTTGFPRYNLQELLVDHENRVWVAIDDGVYRLDGPKEGFKLVGSDHYFDLIVDMDEDAAGNIWMVKANGGLLRFDGKYMIQFDETDGLVNNNVSSIQIQDGIAWLGTVNGIDRLDVSAFNATKKIHFENIGKDKGFLPLECTPLRYHSTQNNSVWLGTRRGITKYYPDLHEHRNGKPFVRIEDIKLNYENVDWIAYTNQIDAKTYLPKDLQLKHNENTLTFSFNAIDFSRPKTIRYEYFLEGLEEEWQLDDGDAMVTYKNLSAGDYTLHVRNQTFNEQDYQHHLQFKFTILSPIWYHPKFILTSVSIIFLFVWTFWAVTKWWLRRRKLKYGHLEALELH
ncbi:MAG: two-component regulator propeller domain-containing protein [Chitinophagales bacterium]